jgi:hypothetical protein
MELMLKGLNDSPKSESEGGQSSPSDSVLGGIVAMWIGALIP